MVSPFFGGGVVELNLAARGIRVYGYDHFEPLVNFYQHFLRDTVSVVETAKTIAREFEDDRPGLVARITDYENIADGAYQAGLFYLSNKLSHCGKTFSSWKPYVAPYYIDGRGDPVRILNKRQQTQLFSDDVINTFIANMPYPLTVDCADFADSLARHPDAFVFADPPYPVKHALYGKGYREHFTRHAEFCDTLKGRSPDYMVCYNDSERVREMYASSYILAFGRHSGINDTRYTELLIMGEALMPNALFS